MSLSGVDAESFFLDALYTARYELAIGLVFLGGWLLGRCAQTQRKHKFKQSGWKQASHQHGNTVPGRARQTKASEKVGRDVGKYDGRPECVNPALLQDPSWAVPQVLQLCQTQVPQALVLFHAAVKAGLKLQEIPEEACRQLFVALVTATIRTGKMDETMKLLSDLRRCGLGVSTSLFASVVKLCTSKHLFVESLAVLDFVCEDPAFTVTDKSVWSCLLFCATEAKAYQRCAVFFERVKACGTPSAKDFGNMLRVAALNRDWDRSLTLIQEMHEGSVEIDSVQYNTALATCVACGKVAEASALLTAMEMVPEAADVITYNTVIKGYAKACQINECFELFERMQSKSLSPSQVTYGILLDCCINDNKLDCAMEVFNKMSVAGCPMNTVLYTTLIKGFVRAGDLEKAMQIYKKMRDEQNCAPDLITFSILIKASCDNDLLEEALKLVEEMLELGLRPDEVVFNNLIAGCARAGNARLGQQLYDDMVKSGVRPSNATFSILIRLHHECKLLEEAVVLLKTEPAKHRVDPEPRLFLQLIQSCIRDRQGKRAIEVYGMLCERSKPTVAAHSSILTTCMRLNMYETAAEILCLAVASGARVDASDTKSVLESAFKKGKTQVVRSMVVSMRAFGHTVDPKYEA